MAFGRFSQFSKKQTPEDAVATEQKSLVLVIDDDKNIREALNLLLSRNYKVCLCASGEEGIQAMNAEVRVIVLDIKMPGKDGLQVYQAVKHQFSDVPIIFHSAYQNLLEAVELRREYKPFGYCHKSGDSRELLDKIAQAISYYEKILRLTEVGRRIRKVGHDMGHGKSVS